MQGIDEYLSVPFYTVSLAILEQKSLFINAVFSVLHKMTAACPTDMQNICDIYLAASLLVFCLAFQFFQSYNEGQN